MWSTCIYRIAVNTCLAYLRKNKERTVELEANVVDRFSEPINSKEQEVDVSYKCISRLPETDRLIITLVLEDKEYPEIASIIGITENNLRVKVHCIKKELTEIYNQHERR